MGYNYQAPGQPATLNNGGFSAGNSGSTGVGSSNVNSGGNGVRGGAGGRYGGFSSGITGTGNIVGGTGNSGINYAPAPLSVPAEFNKEYFTYSAPDEEFNDGAASQQIAGTLKKNLRVVFIKTPENQALTNAALQLAKQANEERTAIYVLNKQADIGELANRLQSIKSGIANKPEVHFVKYRTPEDAVRAQQAIQAQYDALGGTSHISNEGVAPVLNFASQPSASYSSSGSLSSYGTPAVSSPKGVYLPPIAKFN